MMTTTTVVYHVARPRDLPEILRLRTDNLRRYADRGAPTLTPDRETITARTREAMDSQFAKCYVALDGERVVGCLMLKLLLSPLNQHQIIAVQEVFVVDPAYRGAGIGGQLLQRGEQWAKDNGAAAVLCLYRADEPHEAWFTDRGYVPLETYVVKPVR